MEADIGVVLATALALGQTALCVTLLATRSLRVHAYAPLLGFFLAAGLIAGAMLVSNLWSPLIVHATTLSIPGFMGLCPALWLYVDALTASDPWQLRRRHYWHLLPVLLGLVAVLLIALLPSDQRHALLVDGVEVDTPLGALVAIYLFALLLLWMILSGCYVFAVFRRLTSYRRQLKDLFSSNERRELGWLGWLVCITVGFWAAVLASLVLDIAGTDALLSPQITSVLLLLLVWTFALWGLRQKPGFDGRYLSDTRVDASPKYERSALRAEQAARIAAKLELAMQTDEVYVDSALSLQALSRHIEERSDYLSQTLNETIGETFFDYVNRWRVEAAKEKLVVGDDTVLSIALAVGFNARSSFYKAFRRETGQTPTEYRKSRR